MATPVLLLKSTPPVRYPREGERVEFLSDTLTDKGPATGEIIGVKTTVDGLYVTVKFADGQATLSWDDLEAAGADVRGGLWMVKSHPAIYRGPASRAQAEAGNYPKRRIAWRGLELVVENEAGSERHFPGGSVRIVFPYGEVRATEGVDGDPVDIIIGPNLETAEYVYVVHQNRAGRWSEYDEDKCMLGFISEEEAQQAFLANYNDPRFLGPISILPVDEFVVKVRATRDAPSMIKSWLATEDCFELLKATVKKTIQVPGYYKADGTFVPPHTQAVHYNPEHQVHDVAHGGVSHSQKQAWKELSGFQWFKDMPADEKAAHVMALATQKQDAASASAAVSGWKAAAKAKKNPSGAQWAAFNALPPGKKAALYDEVKAAAGSFAHLKPPAEHTEPAAAAPAPKPASVDDVINVAQQLAAQNAGKEADAKAADQLEEIGKSGSFYQKEALKKLQGDTFWQAMDASEKLGAVMDLYKKLQGAASQSAAVSLWKKAMLNGKVPSPAQQSAYTATVKQDPQKAMKLWSDVVEAIGGDKATELIAAASKGAVAPAPAPSPTPTAVPAPPSWDDLVAAMKTGGLALTGPLKEYFDSLPLQKKQQAIAAASTFTPSGPKEGDTKEGADGTLVFENGRWHKQEAAAPAKKTVEEYQDLGGKAGGISPHGTAVKNAATHAAAGNIAGVKNVLSQIHASKPKTKAAVQAILDAAEKDLGQAPAVAAALPAGWKAEPNALTFTASSGYEYKVGVAANGTNLYVSEIKDGKLHTHEGGLLPMGALKNLNEDYGLGLKPSFLHHIEALLAKPAPAKAPRLASVTPTPSPAASGGLPDGWSYQAATNSISGPAGNPKMKFSVYAEKGSYKVNLVNASGEVASTQYFSFAADVAGFLQANTRNAPSATQLAALHGAVAQAGAKPAPAPAVAAAKLPKFAQVFWHTTDGHNKQWAVSKHGTELITTYGPIGKKQQTTVKTFPTGAAAAAAMSDLIAEKLKKGYQEKPGMNMPHMHTSAAEQVAQAVPLAPAGGGGISAETFDEVMTASGAYDGAPPSPEKASVIAAAKAAAMAGDMAALKKLYNDAPATLGAALFGGLAMVSSKMQQAAKAGAPGPKDGDTKPAADGGTLAFKDGHWHKVETPQPNAKLSQSDIDAVVFAKFGVSKAPNNAHLVKVFEAVKAGELTAAVDAYANIKPVGAPKSKATAAALIQMLKAAKAGTLAPPSGNVTFTPAKPATSPAPAAAPKVATIAPSIAPAAAVKPGQAQPMDGWTKVGEQKGSNPGGTFKDKVGGSWYCKFPGSEDVARNEVLAAKFYQMLGVKVPFVKLVKKDGKLGIASKVMDGLKKGDASALAKAKGTHEGFVFDAWMGNWDVIGLSNDNLLLDKEGAAVRVDPGGALVYRAQGGKKTDFGGTVPELETMLDAKKNPQAAAVFKGVGKGAIDAGVAKLNMLKPSQITELVQLLGPGSGADKQNLAETLIERRAFILKKFGVVDQWDSQKKLDPTKLPVNPKDLPKPIDFFTLNAGKPYSSKEWKNKANSEDSAALIAFAAKGNLTALKDYKYDAYDDATGKPIGKKPITEHPSNKIQEQWAGLVELLQSIYAPSLPTLEMPSMGAVGALEEISSFVGAFQPTDRPETVATEHRLGFFMALNQIDDIHELVKDMKWSFIQKGGAWTSKMKAGYAGLSALVRKYIGSVQASGSINHVWSQGKSEAAGVGVNKLAAEIYKQAVDIPEGTVLRRGMSDTTAGKMMSKQLLNAKPGLVIQNTDSMCTSFNESHSWPGDIVMTIRCAKGCKATPSFASGSYSSEYEITTLPGQRYVVLGTKKVGSQLELDVLMLPPHEGYIAELAKLSSLGKALQSVILFLRKVVS